jgi:hypothetical protein
LKGAAVIKAKGKKSKLMFGMAGIGAVIGTVASGGAVAIGLIAGVAGGAIGHTAGKKHVKHTQKAIERVQFEGIEERKASE